MPSAAPRPRTCPACHRSVPVGKYCSARCREEALAAPSPESTAADAVMIYSAEALNKGASAYLAAAHAAPSSPVLLAELGKFWVLVQDAEAALVHRGRLQGDSWDSLAGSTDVSKERLRKRWKSLSLHHRVQKIKAQAAQAAEARTAEPLPAMKHPVPSQTPGQQLAGALSFLQRKTGQALAGTAAEMEISPSYLSRIVSGQRNPSWQVVQRFGIVCGGHLAELRDLWEAAHRPPDPHLSSRGPAPYDQVEAREKFHTALRALYLANGCPPPQHIAQLTDDALTDHHVSAALTGEFLPDWPATSRLILALRGRPAELQPLWNAASAPPPD